MYNTTQTLQHTPSSRALLLFVIMKKDLLLAVTVKKQLKSAFLTDEREVADAHGSLNRFKEGRIDSRGLGGGRVLRSACGQSSKRKQIERIMGFDSNSTSEKP